MKIKNLLKKIGLIVVTLCVMLCSCTFLIKPFSFKNVNAETSQDQSTNYEVSQDDFNQILNDVAITIPSYSFNSKDFSSIVQSNAYYSCLYTHDSVTISTTENFTSNDIVFVTIKDSDGFDITNDCVENIGSKTYYNISTIVNEDRLTQIEIELRKYIPASGDKKASTKVTRVNFFLVQTFVDFDSSSQIKWAYEHNTSTYNIAEPSNGAHYNSSLRVMLPSGSVMNPVYLHFEYLGQDYTIYNINGTYYNAFDQSKLDIQMLNFNKSGEYKVSIYDNTYVPNSNSNNPSVNHVSHYFTVKNSADPFYIKATDSNNNILMDGEYSTQTVKLDFVNINEIIDDIGEIEVVRSYSPTGGVNIPESTIYSETQITNNFSLTLENSGTYHIYVKDDTRNKNLIYSFKFVVLKDIVTSFTITVTEVIDGEETTYDKTYALDNSTQTNATKTETIHQEKEFEYNNIKGESQFEFTVMLARSQPSITGIDNNARTSDPVYLRVYGVGNIQVNITHNGKTETVTKTNGQRLDTISEQGKYFIQITDQMGNSVTRSFNVTVKLNTSSIVLIGVAAGAVVGLIIFIIISRSKVKVR